MSSHPWTLFEIKFLIMRWKSSSLMSKRFSVLQENTGSLLDLSIGYLEREKNELKRLTFCLKSEIRVVLNERGGIVRIILLLRELFITDQYGLADIFG